MNKKIRIGILIIFALFTFGLVGALYDDPIQQVGITAMMLSGFGTVYLITILTRGMATFERSFMIMASLLCLLTVSRVLRWPVLFILLLSLICFVGLVGLIVRSLINIKNSKKIDGSNFYLIFSTTIIVLFLIDYVFRLGIISNNTIRAIIHLFVVIFGGCILRSTNVLTRNYPVILLIFIYTMINLIAFITFRIAELI